MQRRIERAATEAEEAVKGSGKKKKKGKKAEEIFQAEEEVRDRKRVANAAYPEYALADLIYVLSYEGELQNLHIGAVSKHVHNATTARLIDAEVA